MAGKRKRKSIFGEYLAGLITDAGMSQFDFYTEAGIAKPELDPIQKQVMVKTEEDFKNNDLMKAI